MTVRVLIGDCRAKLAELPAESVHCVVTSPPYFGLRDYKVDGQIGLEATPDAYMAELVAVFREVRRVLRDDGTVWLNLGDSYAGYHGNKNNAVPTSAVNGWTNGTNENLRTSTANRNGLKPKDLIGVPWAVAFALRADGWYLRQDIIWAKPNPMPESVQDRCTKSHEYVFLLSKRERYWYDAEAIAESASGTSERPQQRRALQLAERAGLTAEHISAIRACGATDTGKAQVTQDGFGRNAARVLALATEAKAALGGYYREFLLAAERNRRSVWTITTQPFGESHFATMPPALAELCIKAGCPTGGTVLDPFGGAGTTGMVAARLLRDAILIELNPDYADMAKRRIYDDFGLFTPIHLDVVEAAE